MIDDIIIPQPTITGNCIAAEILFIRVIASKFPNPRELTRPNAGGKKVLICGFSFPFNVNTEITQAQTDADKNITDIISNASVPCIKVDCAFCALMMAPLINIIIKAIIIHCLVKGLSSDFDPKLIIKRMDKIMNIPMICNTFTDSPRKINENKTGKKFERFIIKTDHINGPVAIKYIAVTPADAKHIPPTIPAVIVGEEGLNDPLIITVTSNIIKPSIPVQNAINTGAVYCFPADILLNVL